MHSTWRPNPQRYLWVDHTEFSWQCTLLHHLYRQCNQDDVLTNFAIEDSLEGSKCIHGVPQCFRARWKACEINQDRRWRGISQTNGGSLQGTRNPLRGDSSLHPAPKWRRRKGKSDHL